MSWVNALAALTALGLLVYLIIALFRAEDL
ncbi:MAG TPA: potassium-transporting ATPase subunit F [Steroidobacteraceae bacterium]|nr:potassium-transporting ATPase subunit F [Steroidobacteraceae bacterium]